MPSPSIFREPSTQRGIVWVVSGLVVLVQTFLGESSVDTASVMSRVEFWTGLAMTIAGALGFLPDRPSNGKPNESIAVESSVAGAPRMQSGLPSDRTPPTSGWNG